ncbi:hypothetical protein II5_05904 [Bacillus cereus MSX-A1]|uniref:ArsR/SmtB family transcription factor n=1 Tax=Bacillus cereus TaxID=1396 RepID=UPI00027978DC|nr:metalloregulator ArsR/SmtB family transcription factor [Bacillus cereus]EJQ97955.1 hypothetical protein II5_05904 [Bacillus cereus MSX-A1]
MEWKSYENLSRDLRVFAHPIRICIVRELMNNEECRINELSNILRIHPTTISQHLWKLKGRNLVMCRKKGSVRVYRACHETMNQITTILMRE